MKTIKFGGTYSSDNLEKAKLFYAWNEYRPHMIFNNKSELIGMYMRVKIDNTVYFITDNIAIETFLNDTSLLKSDFFLQVDIDTTEISSETISNYFKLIG